MGKLTDIDTIHCYIDLSLESNQSLLDRRKIHKTIIKDVEQYFKKYGLSYEIIPLGGMGGGGWSNLFWEGLKIALDNKDILAFIISSVKILWNIPNIIKSLITSYISNSYLKVVIDLSLKSNTPYTNEELLWFNPSIQKKLVNLKFISDDLCNNLKAKYSIFKFDQSFSISVSSREFWVTYNLPAEKQNKFNSYRLIKLFNSIEVRDKFYSIYDFTKFLLISREDGGLSIKKSYRMRSPKIKYYLFISTKIIDDYINSLKMKIS